MNSEWLIDLEQEEARHREIAFKVKFSGTPGSQSFEGSPSFPPGLTSLDQVRLIRESYQVYEAAYREAVAQSKRNNKVDRNQRPLISSKRRKSHLISSET